MKFRKKPVITEAEQFFHKEDAGSEYEPPDESDCVLRVSLEIGDTEEADRQMRLPTKMKRPMR